jgi:hypothetical protein
MAPPKRQDEDMDEFRVSPYCRIVRRPEGGMIVEGREHPYGSWLPVTGDLFLSSITNRELAGFCWEHREERHSPELVAQGAAR